MRPGFSTNSIGDVPPADAVAILADLGYRSLALTPDHGIFEEIATGSLAGLSAEIDHWRSLLAAKGMACVVESGARHLLDPLHKHEPTLVSPDPSARQRRVDFLLAAVDLAAELNANSGATSATEPSAPCLSLWSGVGRDAASDSTNLDRLCTGLRSVIERATKRGVRLGFEPEPGMVIDTIARWAMLRDRLGNPPCLGLSVDLGHLECMGEWPLAATLAPLVPHVVNVHVDDMLACRHDHLPLGAGDVDFAALLPLLAAGGYDGGIHVELPRQSHRWLDTARESISFLAHHLPPATVHSPRSYR
jgi:sugar phosphate isomerase/epimerase